MHPSISHTSNDEGFSSDIQFSVVQGYKEKMSTIILIHIQTSILIIVLEFSGHPCLCLWPCLRHDTATDWCRQSPILECLIGSLLLPKMEMPVTMMVSFSIEILHREDDWYGQNSKLSVSLEGIGTFQTSPFQSKSKLVKTRTEI